MKRKSRCVFVNGSSYFLKTMLQVVSNLKVPPRWSRHTWLLIQLPPIIRHLGQSYLMVWSRDSRHWIVALRLVVAVVPWLSCASARVCPHRLLCFAFTRSWGGGSWEEDHRHRIISESHYQALLEKWEKITIGLLHIESYSEQFCNVNKCTVSSLRALHLGPLIPLTVTVFTKLVALS